MYRVPRQAPDVHIPKIDYVSWICIPVCSIRTSVSLPFRKQILIPVPRSPRPPSEALKSIAAIFRLAYYAVLHFAILPECHLHATFPLTCINIYSGFPAALRKSSEVVTFITFDSPYFKNIKIHLQMDIIFFQTTMEEILLLLLFL